MLVRLLSSSIQNAGEHRKRCSRVKCTSTRNFGPTHTGLHCMSLVAKCVRAHDTFAKCPCNVCVQHPCSCVCVRCSRSRTGSGCTPGMYAVQCTRCNGCAGNPRYGSVCLLLSVSRARCLRFNCCIAWHPGTSAGFRFIHCESESHHCMRSINRQHTHRPGAMLEACAGALFHSGCNIMMSLPPSPCCYAV